MRTVKIVVSIFGAIGLGLLVGAFYWTQSALEFRNAASRAEGSVVRLVESRSDGSTLYAPAVRFRDAGGEEIEFVSSVSSSPPSYSIGERVTVLYRATLPQDARIDDFTSLWLGPVVTGAFGSVFFLIGAGVLLALWVSARRAVYLQRHGLPVMADFQRVELDTSLRVNGRHPYRIVGQWVNPLTSEVHVFESQSLWFDPTEFVKTRHIKVFIERDNPRKYHVDVSFLPRRAS